MVIMEGSVQAAATSLLVTVTAHAHVQVMAGSMWEGDLRCYVELCNKVDKTRSSKGNSAAVSQQQAGKPVEDANTGAGSTAATCTGAGGTADGATSPRLPAQGAEAAAAGKEGADSTTGLCVPDSKGAMEDAAGNTQALEQLASRAGSEERGVNGAVPGADESTKAVAILRGAGREAALADRASAHPAGARSQEAVKLGAVKPVEARGGPYEAQLDREAQAESDVDTQMEDAAGDPDPAAAAANPDAATVDLGAHGASAAGEQAGAGNEASVPGPTGTGVHEPGTAAAGMPSGSAAEAPEALQQPDGTDEGGAAVGHRGTPFASSVEQAGISGSEAGPGSSSMQVDEADGRKDEGERGWVPLVHAPANRVTGPAVLIRPPLLEPAAAEAPAPLWREGERVEVGHATLVPA